MVGCNDDEFNNKSVLYAKRRMVDIFTLSFRSFYIKTQGRLLRNV